MYNNFMFFSKIVGEVLLMVAGLLFVHSRVSPMDTAGTLLFAMGLLRLIQYGVRIRHLLHEAEGRQA